MIWSDALLDSKRTITDPLADEVVEKIIAERGEPEARNLFDLLIRQLETPVDQLPEVARHYLRQTNQLPEWADPEKIALAHELFIDHGPKMLLFLYYRSLPTLYSCANGAQVLYHTARLVHDPTSITAFTRRIAETAQFLMDVMTPGNLKPGATGIRSIQKVRLIHASVRKFVRNKEWNPAWGLPINQEDLAITLMTFSVSLLDSLRKIKVEEDQERQEAFFHTWMAIGSLLGIDRDLLPNRLSDGYQLYHRILHRQSKPSEEGKLLTNALIRFSEEVIPGKALDDTPEAMVYFLAGPEIAQNVGLKKMPGCLSWLGPSIMQFVFRLAERLEEKSDQWKRRIDRYALRLTQAMLAHFNDYKGTNFSINDQLLKEWEIDQELPKLY